MKYTRTSLWFLAVAGMLSVAVITGCGPKKDAPAKDVKDKDKDKEKEEENKAFKFEQVDKASFGDKIDVTYVAKSGDNKNVYVVVDSRKALYQADATDLTKWNAIAWDATNGTGLSDDVGAAKLAASTNVWGLVSTKEGVLVQRMVEDPTKPGIAKKSPDNGVAFLKGNAWSAAWGSEKKHVLEGDITSVLGGGLSAAVVKNAAGVEFPVFIAGTAGISGDLVANFANARAGQWVGPSAFGKPNSFSGVPKVAMTDDGAYFVDSSNVYFAKSADIGNAKNLHLAGAKNAGSAKWKFAKGPDNNTVNDAVYHNGKLYIALNSDGKGDTGGVVTYDPKAAKDNVVAPVDGWKKISVIGFVVDGSDLWAITSGGVFSTDKSKTLGAEGIPADITGAVVVNNTWVVGTKSGLFSATK